MTTTLRRPRPEFAPLLFLLWAALVLGAYLLTHPLPLRPEVPVWRGLLTVALMLLVSWPLWRHADPRRGFQVEHLLLLPILLAAALAMLPVSLTPEPAGGVVMLFLLWACVAELLRQRLGRTGFLLALLVWFPGSFAVVSAAQLLLTVLFLALLALPLWAIRKRIGGEPHRYVYRVAVAALVVGVLLSLADIQRRCAPVGYLAGVVDGTSWRAQNCIENPGLREDWSLRR